MAYLSGCILKSPQAPPSLNQYIFRCRLRLCAGTCFSELGQIGGPGRRAASENHTLDNRSLRKWYKPRQLRCRSREGCAWDSIFRCRLRLRVGTCFSGDGLTSVRNSESGQMENRAVAFRATVTTLTVVLCGNRVQAQSC